MQAKAPFVLTGQSDEFVFDQLTRVQKVCLAAATLTASLALCVYNLPALGAALPWFHMTASSALSALAAAAGLAITLPGASRTMHGAAKVLAFTVAFPAALDLLQYKHPFSPQLASSLDKASTGAGSPMTPMTAGCFIVLALVLYLLRARTGIARFFADGAAFVLEFLVLIAVSVTLLGATHLFGAPPSGFISRETLIVLCLLSFVAFGRRAEFGVSSILIGSGVGSRIARLLAPFLMIMPYLREIGRALMLHRHLFPENIANGIIASLAATLSLGVLVYVSRRIQSMEEEIRDLSLRDELTGLYNLRGFRFLAEQSLQLARRCQSPFAVLFVDLDDLKQINDRFGHAAGSAYLAETGKLMKRVFREADVVGRIGGDEFAIAGHFSPTALSIAATRLEQEAATERLIAGKKLPLRFSMGYVSSHEHERSSLQELLDKADAAMYKQKRSKKPQIV